jgi:hypothetical protein
MYDLKEKEALFRVRRYDLYRNDGLLSVDVQEVIAGESAHKFYAIPSLAGNPCNQEEYLGAGESVTEALEDCLRRIKDVPVQVLFPPPE